MNKRSKKGNSSWNEERRVVMMEVNMSATPRTLRFFVDGEQQPLSVFNIPDSIQFAVSLLILSLSFSLFISFSLSLQFTMRWQDDAISLTRLEEVPNEKGIALPNEMKGDYIKGKWDDDMEILVECVNGKKIEMIVNMKETFRELNERVTKESHVMSELSFLYIEEKEVNESRTIDEMDVSDGCVIVQKISPLANLLKPDTLTPSVVSSVVEYVETVEIWNAERILTNAFSGKAAELI
jgi:hypothetical protein